MAGLVEDAAFLEELDAQLLCLHAGEEVVGEEGVQNVGVGLVGQNGQVLVEGFEEGGGSLVGLDVHEARAVVVVHVLGEQMILQLVRDCQEWIGKEHHVNVTVQNVVPIE